jgi:hypothetical protein
VQPVELRRLSRIIIRGSFAHGRPGAGAVLLLHGARRAGRRAPERRRARLADEVLRGAGVAADVLVWTRRTFEERLGVVTSLPATVVPEGRVLLGE